MISETTRHWAERADWVLSAGATPFTAAGLYLGVLSVLGRPNQRRQADVSRDHGTAVAAADARTSFAIVVPAHNESVSIGATVASLLQVDYPPHLVNVVVVADNCSDDTAERARVAGADVLVRVDPSRRGKGYALDHAFSALLRRTTGEPLDAVVVVDADTRISSNLLLAFDRRLQAGAQALQASHRVSNAAASWRTTLMAIAFTCIHDVRSHGRERLGLSAGLRGNGMCFSTAALRQVPHRAASLVEDVEHGIDLARQGIRVEYVGDAFVEAEMPERSTESASQRERWERGRRQLRRTSAVPLLREAITSRDPVRADLAVDLLIPPLASVTLGLGASAAAGGVVSLVRRGRSTGAVMAAVGSAALALHVVEGWRQSGTGKEGLKAFGRVPGYIGWKLGLKKPTGHGPARSLRSDDPNAEEWVRTTRNAERADLKGTGTR